MMVIMKDKITDLVAEIFEYLPKNRSGAPLAPINISKAIELYGLKAYDVDFKGQGISGAFDRSKMEIYVNSSDPYVIKIFTLAHELGHYLLHKDVKNDVLFREKGKHGREKIEREANTFAAELLMPEAAIKIYWPITENIQQLADKFSVSYVAMRNRLHQLGLI